MNITEIHVHPIAPKDGLVAFANVVIEDALYLGSIGIHEKKDGSGYRLTYPMKGKGYVFNPMSEHLSKKFEIAILHKVKEVIRECHVRHGGIKSKAG